MRTRPILLCSIAFVFMTTLAHPAITLGPLFGDRAVLQRDKPLPVWGRAEPGEKIAVSFRDQTVQATAGADGRWIVYLTPLAASAEPAELIVTGKSEKLVLQDVLVGEVWLGAGQSNMEWPVSSLREEERTFAAIDLPLVRHLRIEQAAAVAPTDLAKTSGWQLATRDRVGGFSALGYFFARDLQRKLGVPVGVVNSSWGGTEIEAWMSDASRQATSLGAAIDMRWAQALSEWPAERVARFPAEMDAWQKAEEQAQATKTPNPLPWPEQPATPTSQRRPGGLFNAMIAPLQPGALRGILWYQGESNVGRPAEYAELFPAMISAWRANWGDADLPFLFVQIPNYADGNPGGRQWARLREAQASALDLPGTAMAVAIDVGDPDSIHPTAKLELSRRLAQIAKVLVYGIPGDFSGPIFATATRESTAGSGQAIRVRFTHAGTGLVAHGQPVQSLELAGADKIYHPAVGRIDRGTLLVTSQHVKEPVTVRYAWSNAPLANLYSGAGLPAAPFRSDDW